LDDTSKRDIEVVFSRFERRDFVSPKIKVLTNTSRHDLRIAQKIAKLNPAKEISPPAECCTLRNEKIVILSPNKKKIKKIPGFCESRN